MVGHGRIVAFDETDRHARPSPATCCTSALRESCGKCFPCRIGLHRAHEMVTADEPGRQRSSWRPCSRRSRSVQPVRARWRHARADPHAARALSRGARSRMRVTVDGTEVEVEDGATVLEAARSAGHDVPVLCFDDRLTPFGACRVCLVGAEGAPGPIPACHHVAPTWSSTCDEPRAASPAPSSSWSLSELPAAPDPHTELPPPSRVSSASVSCAGPVSSARSTATPVIRTCAAARTLHLLRALRPCVATSCRGPSR